MSFALLISRLFEPIVLFVLLLLIVFYRLQLPTTTVVYQSLIIILVMIVLPLVLLLRALKKNTISNWDISNRKQRVGALGIFLGIFACGIFLLSLSHVPAMTNFFLYLFGVLFLFFCVTLVYKMSGHLTVFSLFLSCVVYWVGGYSSLLFLLLPLLCYSRVVLKRHTVGQVLLGTVFGLTCAWVGLYFKLIP